MKFLKIKSFLLLAAITMFALSEGAVSAGEIEINENLTETADDRVAFRPVDCGIQVQEVYDYPFLGMTFSLPETILDKIDSREVFVFAQEEYFGENEIAYAFLRFSSVEDEQRAEEGMSADIFSWENELKKIGAIGVYQKEITDQISTLTNCDVHEKIGESADGSYEYYLSIHLDSEQELAEELKKTEISIGEMQELNLELGDTAFSETRINGLENLGEFSTEDVFGNAYTQEMFQAYDLTLVNVMATWCSPCVNEIPELEKLRQEYEQKNVNLGIAAIVLDTRIQSGVDEGALERAQILYERSGAQFPFLIPDQSGLNGRLFGIESIPQSFFVDAQGNIVSEPYVGAHSLEGWTEIVEQELAKLQGAEG